MTVVNSSRIIKDYTYIKTTTAYSCIPRLLAPVISQHLFICNSQGRIQSLERGGHLAEKQLKTKKKKKITTIIASYPLPNISRLLCKIKSYL